MSNNKIATIVERKGGTVEQIGDFRISINEKLKLDQIIYNDILARRGFDALKDNLTRAQYADKFGADPSEYESAKDHAIVALQHVVPEQFRVATETELHLEMKDMLRDVKQTEADAEDASERLKGIEVRRKVIKDYGDMMERMGLSSNRGGDQFTQAKEVLSLAFKFIIDMKDEAKRYTVECPHCHKMFMADVSEKYEKNVVKFMELIKGYDIMDAEYEDVE